MGFVEFHPTYPSGGALVLPKWADAKSAAVLRWSHARTWGGKFPTASDVVQVPRGRTLLIDQDIHVAALDIEGAVTFADKNLRVRVGGVLVRDGGVLRAGDAQHAFAHQLTITLGNAAAQLQACLDDGFFCAINGGRIELFGQRRNSWVVLRETAAPGAIAIRLKEPVDWRAGERLVLASGGVDLPLVEERVVVDVSIDRMRVTLDRPVQHRHLGCHSNVFGALPGTIGKVALLSRSIVIEGEGNAGGGNAYCTVHAAAACFIGVELRGLGQFNAPGRYPLFWRDNTADCEMTDCVVLQSFQRGVVVMNSPQVKLQSNVVYRPLGHGFIVDSQQDAASLIATNLTVRPRTVRFADPAMRAMCEHRPRSVWFAGQARPSIGARALPVRTATH